MRSDYFCINTLIAKAVKWNDRIRSGLALFQAALFCLIIASGTVFMHKHKTADGKIVIHIHPYNLKKDSDGTKHHQSETEIHLLDVVFQGSYVQPTCAQVDFPLVLKIETLLSSKLTSLHIQDVQQFAYLRGPPTSA